jgi:hypothetical protein
MNRLSPDNLADALDKELLELHAMFNRGLDAVAQLRQVLVELRAKDEALGFAQDGLCDWSEDKRKALGK